MKKILLSLAAVATVGSALPAAAQTWDHNRPTYDHNRPTYEHNVPNLNGALNQREAELRTRIDRAVARHQISRQQPAGCGSSCAGSRRSSNSTAVTA